ncbi:hypothetical protein ASG39_04685 [Rhizobium sp. Leaf371]|nr:hypothetical protein ASG39_04685 [Rhizobium sp. Leaf371]
MTAAEAILELLPWIGAMSNTPVSLLEIGPPLVGQGFTQEDILDALMNIDGRTIELLPHNMVRLVNR